MQGNVDGWWNSWTRRLSRQFFSWSTFRAKIQETRIRVSSVKTHFPKDRNCEICQRTKITRAPYRRRNGGVVPRAENVGDLVTADHKVLSDNCESRNNHQNALVVQDLATQWIQAYPCKTKTLQETQRSLQKFVEPDRKLKVIYTDNSLEFGKACEDLSWNHYTSTPHRSETNGIAERTLRRVKEGTSAVLLQSGLKESWWADSMEWYTYLRNVTDLFLMGRRPMKDVLGNHLNDRLFHSVHWLIITLKLRRTSQESINLERKSYLDCSSDMLCTRGGIWKGDVLVADLEELETMDASEIYSKRLNAKEVIFPKEKGKYIFPIADGRIKTLGGDQDLRTSTLVRHRPNREESNIDFLGESEGSLPRPQDSLPDAGEAINDFWSMSGSFKNRHHVEPRVKLYWPREESFPFPLKYIDVSRTTHTNLDEYRWIKRFVRSMDRFHSVYSIWRKTSRRIYVVAGEINDKTAGIQARSFMARTLGENVKECQAEGEAKVVTWKAPSC